MIRFVALLFLTVISYQSSTAQTSQQQVIPGELPDPSIIEVNGVYYASGSSNDWGPVFPIYKSTDRRHWTFVTYVFSKPPAWTINSYWAPELFYHNGLFYCYYTARRTDGVSCVGVATTKNIESGFQDKGVLIEWGKEAIDAFVYNENGTLYVSWKANGLTPGKSIQIMGSALSPDGLSLKGAAFEILTAEKNTWEAGGIEGQCVIKNDGYLYMLYSGNGCCGGGCDYQVGVARAKSMQGPWEKYKANPLIKSNDAWKCPGHGTALKTKNQYIYLYHAYPAKGFPWMGRSAIMSNMKWGKDGWPSFEISGSDNKVLKENITDPFNTGKLERWWRYDVASYQFNAAVKGGALTLTDIKRDTKNNTGAALCVNPATADFTMTTKVIEQNEALKGLLLYGTSSNSIGLGVKGNAIILWKVQDGAFTELNTIEATNVSDIQLKAIITDAHQVRFLYSTDGTNWVTVPGKDAETVAGDHLAWWSWGIKAGLFVKSDPESGANKAVFDEFSIIH